MPIVEPVGKPLDISNKHFYIWQIYDTITAII